MPTSWTIGSAPDCDLVVDFAVVSGRHCRLTSREGGYLLEDLGSTNGTYVNGLRVQSPVVITRTDVVTLGQAQPMPWPFDIPAGGSPTVVAIGREMDNDIVIPLATVSGHHARALWDERSGGMIVEDLGSSNGMAIGSPDRKTTRAAVTANDTIFLGSHPLPAARVFEWLAASQSSAARQPITLGALAAELIIGRDSSCDYVIANEVVSSRHARLSRQEDGSVRVEDLGSANGTSVNGVRIGRFAVARDGDKISLGGCELQVRIEPAVAASLPEHASGIASSLMGREAAENGKPIGKLFQEEIREICQPVWKPALWAGFLVVAAAFTTATARFDPQDLASAEGWAAGAGELGRLLSGLALSSVLMGLLAGLLWGPLPTGQLGRGMARALSLGWGIALGGVLVLMLIRALSNGGAVSPAVLAVLLPTAWIGLGLGLTLRGASAEPVLAWVIAILLTVPLWGLEGHRPSWSELPGWARTIGGLNPSRWAFEGLLLVESARHPVPEGAPAEHDLVEPYFPAETDRMGPIAVGLALGAMLLGWGAAATVMAGEAGPARLSMPDRPSP